MNLTQFSYYLRKFLPFGVVGFILLMVFFIIVRLLISTSAQNQKEVSIFNPIFKKISAPVYEASSSAFPQSYFLDNVEGKPVTATQAAKIYFLPPTSANLSYREKIYLMAKSFGFSSEIKHTLNGSQARFDDGKQKLSIDITNFNFSYRYEASLEANLFVPNGSIPTQEQSVQRASDFLRSVGRYPTELSKGKTKTVYLSYSPVNQSLYVVGKPELANVVEVDFYRPDTDTTDSSTIVSPTYFNSQHYVVMTMNNAETHVIRAQVKFFEKSDEQVGIYPVRTGEDAWEQLKARKAHIVSSGTDAVSVTIKKMYVAYLDPSIYQEYLQPVYVFLGDKGFVGYVTAVTDEYVLP